MEQFLLEKWLENPSRKVVTRDGKEVALFGSASGNEQYPVKGMVERNPTICTWTKTGISYCNGNPHSDDLFFADEKEELTEFEKEVAEAYEWAKTNEREEFVNEFAPKLFDLARKELQPEFDKELDKAYKTADDVQYQHGKQDALKDLPRWKKTTENKEFDKHILLFEDYEDRVVLTTELYTDEYYIELDDLKKLPKEE